ncbi:hypothetical protein [Dactylosporangium sp. CA-139066]|uniref:hypothetical protein n=1 Tax=Dactylosporangium sp. CA-139066 TaxID=3239930 RepID=UPI003D8B5676
MINDDVEERLREALRLHAADAPPGAAMLSTVTTESVRRGKRARLAAFSSGAAALVAIGAAIPFALSSGGAAPQVAADRPGAASTLTPAPIPANPSAAPAGSTTTTVPLLVQSTVPASVTFPFTAPALAGYGQPRIALTGGHPTSVQVLAKGVSADLTLYSERPPAPTSKTTSATTAVNGQTATVYEWRYADDDPTIPFSDLERTLVWQPSAGQWLSLRVTPAASTADLVAYAEAVKPGGAKAQAPFTFGLMPAGWTTDNIDGGVVTVCPPGVTPDPSYEHKLAVMLDETAGIEPKFGNQAVEVQVAGRRAWLTSTDEGQTLQIPQPGGRSLLLQIAPEAALPRDLLLRFAATIEVTPSAQVGHG